MSCACSQDSFYSWANRILKCQDAVLTKVKDNISFVSFMDLHNSPLSRATELFSKDAVERAVEKSSRGLHGKAIQKAVSLNKPAKKSTKRL